MSLCSIVDRLPLTDLRPRVTAGFDSVKFDGCSAQHNMTLWAQLLNQTGRPAIVENCHVTAVPSRPVNEGGCPDFHLYRCVLLRESIRYHLVSPRAALIGLLVMLDRRLGPAGRRLTFATLTVRSWRTPRRLLHSQRPIEQALDVGHMCDSQVHSRFSSIVHHKSATFSGLVRLF